MTKKQKLPKWFDGELYEIGDEVRNPFSGEKIELNKYELSMYDFIMGATMALEAQLFSDGENERIAKDLDKGMRWFTKNNPKAYMVLLD